MIINMNGAKAPETPSPVLQEKTVTPQTLPTVIGADEGYTGLSQVTVNPDTNLKAENIRSGKTIFGVGGSFVGEPQYTDVLDNSKLKARARALGGSIFAITAPLWNNSPTRLTELDYEKNDWINNDSWIIAYDSGAVVDGDGVPSFSSSGSPSNPSSYYFYKEHGSYVGSVKFYIPYGDVMSPMGWTSSSTYPTHIKGTLYIYLVLCSGSYSSGVLDLSMRKDRRYGYGSGIYEIQVDSDLTFEKADTSTGSDALTFTVDVPQIEGDVIGMFYSAPVRVGAALFALPRKTVIS